MSGPIPRQSASVGDGPFSPSPLLYCSPALRRRRRRYSLPGRKRLKCGRWGEKVKGGRRRAAPLPLLNCSTALLLTCSVFSGVSAGKDVPPRGFEPLFPD